MTMVQFRRLAVIRDLSHDANRTPFFSFLNRYMLCYHCFAQMRPSFKQMLACFISD